MDKTKIIVHVSEIDISPNGGMGRVESSWKNAFEKAGYSFIHIGPKEVGKIRHKALFSYRAYQYFNRSGIHPCAVIVHEPAALFFTGLKMPVFIESHGIERRYWEYELKNPLVKIPFTTKITFPLWRLFSCDRGLQKADKLLLINSDDKAFAVQKYKRKEEDIFIFKNGVNPVVSNQVPEKFTVLFNGSWISRKGNSVLTDAARILFDKGYPIHYLLIGTGKQEEQVRSDWPKELRKDVEVVSHFSGSDEIRYLRMASIVVLPSNFEGQPLSILQAMAAGKCCITTNCCGQKDFIENNVTGYLFEPSDHHRLAELIGQCFNDPGLVDAVGLAAKKSMKDRTWEKVSSEIVAYVTDNI